jgi:hypothetical protein
MTLYKLTFITAFLFLAYFSFPLFSAHAAYGDCRDGGALACTNECVSLPNQPDREVCTPKVCAPQSSGPYDTRYTCVSVRTANGDIDLEAVTNTNFSLRLPREGALGEFVNRVTNFTLPFSFVILFVYLVWGSFRYLMAGGDPKAIAGAKAHLTWAIIGTIVVFLSFGLFRILSSLLGNVY